MPADDDEDFPRALVLLHRMRNRLAGVLTNVELVEMLLRDAGETLTPAQRDDMLTALGYARTSGRELAELLRDLAPPSSKTA